MRSGGAEFLFSVLDANVVVSAALTSGGTPYQAVLSARRFTKIALSASVFHEISAVLVRPKFKAALTQARISEILLQLNAAAVWFAPEAMITDCRDEKDNRYLELALTASSIGRTIMLSGDDDLLALNPWRGIPIVRPAGFLRALAE